MLTLPRLAAAAPAAVVAAAAVGLGAAAAAAKIEMGPHEYEINALVHQCILMTTAKS